MKQKISGIVGISIAALAAGCTQEKPKPQPTSVLDVRPVQQPEPQPPQPVQPQAIEPPAPRKPVKATSSSRKVTPPPTADISVSGPASAPAGQSYTVQKGDTLFGIAKKVYGDGTKWNKIVEANPGVSPTSLKVGQTLVVPQ